MAAFKPEITLGNIVTAAVFFFTISISAVTFWTGLSGKLDALQIKLDGAIARQERMWTFMTAHIDHQQGLNEKVQDEFTDVWSVIGQHPPRTPRTLPGPR